MSAPAASSSRILTTPPVVAEGKVFAKDAQSTVSAFDADTGQLIWSVTLKPEKARDGDEFGGGLACTTAAACSSPQASPRVFSLDPNDGKEIWRSTVSAPVRGAPLAFADRVFAISIDNKLHAMAAVDGADLWPFTGLQESRAMSTATVRPARASFVVAPFTSGELVAVRIDNGRRSGTNC